MSDIVTEITNTFNTKNGLIDAQGTSLDELIALLADKTAETSTLSWNQQRTEVSNYMNNVSYDASDYSTSQIDNYVSTTSSNHPVGGGLTLNSAGTLYLIGADKHISSFNISAAGAFTVYNCIPNQKSYFILVNNNGEIKQTGILLPTGQVRMLRLYNLDNVRDIGGWACDGGTVKYGKLYRGGEPYSYIQPEGLNYALGLLGIERELSLVFDSDLNGRTESGFGKEVDMTHIDMSWNSLEWIKSQGYITNLINPILDNVIGNHPTYFHCSAGADRTGALALMIEAILGMSQSDMDKDYELTNFYTGVSTDALARRRNETVWTREIDYINTYSGSTFRDKMVNFLISCGVKLEKINAFRSAMIDGNPAALTASISNYSITNNLISVINSNSDISIAQYQPYNAKLMVENKVINSIKITMGGTDITSQCFKGSYATLNRTITYNLTDCTTSNTRNWVIDGQSFVATITPNTGKEISTISITMGGIDMSNYYSEGTISIPVVNGDIVITATAVNSAPACTNLIDNSVNMAGTKIGKQWMYSNMRYNSSSGDPVANNGTNITGLVPVKVGDTVRIKWSGNSDRSYQSIKFFQSDISQCTTGYISFNNLLKDGSFAASGYVDDISNGYAQFTVKSNASTLNCAYMAVCLIESDINNVIITVNEETS